MQLAPPRAPRHAAPTRLLREDGSLEAAAETAGAAHALPDGLALAIYEAMVLVRGAEDRFVRPSDETSARDGLEAVVVGAAAGMRGEDWVFPAPYALGASLWRGMPLATAARRASGVRADAYDTSSKAARVASVSSLPGRHIPHAVGAAWAARLRGESQAVLVYLELGASDGGDFHTAMNFAGVARAPVVAVCPVRDGEPPAGGGNGAAAKAVAYGLRAARVDGADVVAVLEVVRQARERATAGQGGTIVDAVFPAQGGSDPLERLRRHLEARSLWGAERERLLHADVESRLERAAEDAGSAVDPLDPPQRHGDLFEDVYAALPWHLREQRARLTRR